MLLLLSAAPVLNADVTVRYKTDFKVGSFLPASLTQPVSNAPKAPFPLLLTLQIKGDKGYSNAGLVASLLDFTKQQLTLIDATHKQFATVYIKDFPGEMSLPSPRCRQFLRQPRKFWNR